MSASVFYPPNDVTTVGQLIVMTTVDRLALPTQAAGYIVYDLDLFSVFIADGSGGWDSPLSTLGYNTMAYNLDMATYSIINASNVGCSSVTATGGVSADSLTANNINLPNSTSATPAFPINIGPTGTTLSGNNERKFVGQATTVNAAPVTLATLVMGDASWNDTNHATYFIEIKVFGGKPTNSGSAVAGAIFHRGYFIQRVDDGGAGSLQVTAVHDYMLYQSDVSQDLAISLGVAPATVTFTIANVDGHHPFTWVAYGSVISVVE